LKSSSNHFSFWPFHCDPRDLIWSADQPFPHLTHVPSVFKGGAGVKWHTTCTRLSLSLPLSIAQQAESRLQALPSLALAIITAK